MYRVVLHAMSLNRDAPMMIILSRLLESMGCNVIITSVRNYMTVIKYWRPHAILYGTLSKSAAILGHWGQAKLFYCAGEGGESREFMDENFYLDNKDIFDVTTRIFTWGQSTIDNLVLNCRERGCTSLESKILNGEKILAVGHPRLDLLRFIPGDLKCGKTIGINTNLNRINCFDGRSALNFLLKNPLHFFWVRSEVREAEIFVELMDRLMTETRQTVSIRPYPNENKMMYRNFRGNRQLYVRPEYSNRILIDDLLDYATWLVRQTVVVCRISTTITEAYLLGIPVVFIDRLSGNEDFHKNRSETHRLLMETAYKPSSMDELFDAVTHPEKITMRPERMQDFWSKAYGLDRGGSALKRMATAIISDLEKGTHNEKPLMNKKVLEYYDNLLFRWICHKDPFHPNFNFKAGYHRVPEHYDRIVASILADNDQ